MQFSCDVTKGIKHVGVALSLFILSSAAIDAHAWCVQNATAPNDGVTVVAASDQLPGAAQGATARLSAAGKTCSVTLDADTQTTVQVLLDIKAGKFGCPGSASGTTCTKVCANDPMGVKLLGKVDLIVGTAKTADPQGQWKTGELIVDYVYNDGRSPDRYRFGCRDQVRTAATPIKP